MDGILGTRDTIIIATMSDAMAVVDSPVFVMQLELEVGFYPRNLQELKTSS